MKLTVFAVILSCCLVHVYSNCGASEVATVQKQFADAFHSNEANLREIAGLSVERSASFHDYFYALLLAS